MKLAGIHMSLVAQVGLVAASFTFPPTVLLDEAVFIGTTSGAVSRFLGIPFAKPPVGDLRLQLPQAVTPYTGFRSADAYGASCVQLGISWPLTQPGSEDCLYLNVVKPADATPESGLPVAVWIYGGGFISGDGSEYDGGLVVGRSITLGQPIIYVSINYRMSAYGFLASQEVKDAGIGNLGLQDQREAMRWVQKYIRAFGGNPEKVTIWGQSAGAISVTLQLLTNHGDTDGLFRAAFMQSGGPVGVGDITNGQYSYDLLVNATDCYGSLNTLQCLRDVPAAIFESATVNVTNVIGTPSLHLPWLPRVDGVFLTADPQVLIQEGSVANVPFINGDCDDEAAATGLSSVSFTTDAQFEEFVQLYWFPNATASMLTEVSRLYPSNVTMGSPFDTGPANALTPQFKRINAFQGDIAFQAPRRFFMQERSGKQPMWSYLSKRLKGTPSIGSFHASDLINMYGPGDMTDYLIRFVSTLDPNGNTGIEWPQYSKESATLLTFIDTEPFLVLSQDTYRGEAMSYLISLNLVYPL